MPEPRDDLKARREKCGLTARDVASLLGVHETTVSSWETGRFRVAPQYERDLAELYASVEAGQGIPDAVVKRAATRAQRRDVLRQHGVPVPQQRTLEKARRALLFIKQYAAQNGHAPSYSAIGRALGAPSAHNMGRRMVQLLEQTGYVAPVGDGEPYRASFELTEKGESA